LRFAAAADDDTTTPYQPVVDDDPGTCSVIGSAAEPSAFSVPFTVSSTRPVSSSAAIPSVVANCTSTPGWMFRSAPEGTVMSPCMMYGLPAGDHVWLMTLPPVIVVLVAALADAQRIAATVAATTPRIACTRSPALDMALASLSSRRTVSE